MHTVEPLDVPSNTISGSFGTNYNDMTRDNRTERVGVLQLAQ